MISSSPGCSDVRGGGGGGGLLLSCGFICWVYLAWRHTLFSVADTECLMGVMCAGEHFTLFTSDYKSQTASPRYLRRISRVVS